MRRHCLLSLLHSYLRSTANFKRHHPTASLHLVTQLDPDALHHSGVAARHFQSRPFPTVPASTTDFSAHIVKPVDPEDLTRALDLRWHHRCRSHLRGIFLAR